MVSDPTPSGLTVMEVPAPAQPAMLAVIVTCTGLAPLLVETANPAEVCPAGTVTLAGTCTCGLLLCRLTRMPPEGAGAVKVTEPLRPVPPMTVLADSPTDATHAAGAAGLTVTEALAPAQPAMLAVIVT